uniref:Chemotaxis protein CheZ n=1 Tax=uncultured bacterium contig00038 TaxID=1181526 RepID=A0A806K114_9BACT|nr:hypothetical protein [uncultured bacterium contig00038]
MDQSDIDALMKSGSGKGTAPKKNKGQAPAASTPPEPPKPATPVVAPAATPTAPAPAAAASSSSASSSGPTGDQKARLITEISSVTSVTERETNKVMDKLDMISQLLDRQKVLITGMMGNDNIQTDAAQSSIQQIMTACSDIQNNVYDAMDLMQFQDITRQKLERIMHHLRQIHDYIVELLGTGFQSSESQAKVSISHTISQTGTTPDENKPHADSVVEEFQRAQKKD